MSPRSLLAAISRLWLGLLLAAVVSLPGPAFAQKQVSICPGCLTCDRVTRGCTGCDATRWLSGAPGAAGTSCVSSCGTRVKNKPAGTKGAQCIDTCPPGQYAAPDSICAPCPAGCAACNARTGACVLCGPDRWLSGAPGAAGTDCVSSCGTRVKRKPAGTKGAQCIDACPTGQYALPNEVCTPCPSGCAGCDAHTGGCTGCGPTQWLSGGAGLAGTLCVASCGSGVKNLPAGSPGAMCLSACPPGQWAPANGVCQSCLAAPSNCLSCDPRTGACLSCASGQRLSGAPGAPGTVCMGD